MAAVKHDAIIPYIEIGRLSLGAFAFTTDFEGDECDILITDWSKELYAQRWNRYALAIMLRDNPPEKVFDLENILSAEDIKELNLRKPDIIDYIEKLEDYYDMKDVKPAGAEHA